VDFETALAAHPILTRDAQCEEILVPAGDYALSDLVTPQTISAFSMDRFPITVELYREFVAADGYGDSAYWDGDGWLWRLKNQIEAPRWWDPDEEHWGVFLRADRPMIGISWFEAQAYCSFRGRRLPTEIEWEVACRGFDGNLYPWGSTWEQDRVGNRDVGPRLTWPVGFFDRCTGPFGHQDLIANVWQWTEDRWPDDDERTVVRGGSWASRQEHCRSDHRNGYEPAGRWSHVGFRTCAKRRD